MPIVKEALSIEILGAEMVQRLRDEDAAAGISEEESSFMAEAVASGVAHARATFDWAAHRRVTRLNEAVAGYVKAHPGATRAHAVTALSGANPELFEQDEQEGGG